MKFVIRDDDISYFTEMQLINNTYSEIFKKGGKVTFTIVPFMAPNKEMKQTLKSEGSEAKSFAKNKGLVKELRELLRKEQIGIAQHGYSHKDSVSGREWEITDKNMILKKLRKGKSHIEKTLGRTVKVFSPPHNTVSPEVFKVLAEEKIDYLGAYNFYPSLLLNKDYLIMTLKLFLHRVKGSKGAYPHILRYRGLKVLLPNTLTRKTSYEHMRRALEEAIDSDGVFCVATHIHTMNNKMKGIILNLMKYAKEHAKRLEFVTAEDAFYKEKFFEAKR